jgi:dipeptidyl aminopeptidase/acylaminoacyl peptidase
VPIETPYSSFRQGTTTAVHGVCIAGSPAEAPTIIRVDLATGGHEVLRRSVSTELDPAYLSPPQAMVFPTAGGQTAHGLYYSPRNPDFVAPTGELPPLLVVSHGGPTGAFGTGLSLDLQYWTSRGFAVLAVNYGGSTGYGRAYRARLDGNWGVVDVEDCCNGAQYLVDRVEVDGQRMAIRGGSAGGYTTLCALTFRDLFRAGASHFGVGDLELLVRDTHKFESRYLDRLVGPYPANQGLYRERSPVHYADRLTCPIIFFQGLDDQVVPPNQAERMVAAMRARGLPVAYLAYPGEGHGFRQADNIRRTLEAELYFYSRIFGFELADQVEPLEIENL